MSGILSVKLAALRCICVSMNWYFLPQRRVNIQSYLPAAGFRSAMPFFLFFFCFATRKTSSSIVGVLPAGHLQHFERGDSRDHLLELVHCRLDLGAGRHVVLDLIHERRVRDASWVGGGIFAAGHSFCQRPEIGRVDVCSSSYPIGISLPLLAIAATLAAV